MSLSRRILSLPLQIESYELAPLHQDTKSGWTRHSTEVRLQGGGHVGAGEDVIYDGEDQRSFQEKGDELALAGTYTLEEFSHRLDGLELFFRPPGEPGHRLYRRWAFESAALSLALRQSGQTLSQALGREKSPTRYVVSTGVGSPPSLEGLDRVLSLYKDMHFKVDYASNWTEAFIDELAARGVVDTVDLKGLYRGSFRGPDADPAMYRHVFESFQGVIIEDPAPEPEILEILAEYEGRVSWDANIHAVSDMESLPLRPGAINIKPSRFGFVSELLRAYEYCEAREIPMYGGGQFELGVGRLHIQELAAIFHPDAPNDVAPSEFNDASLSGDLPTPPLDTADAFGPGRQPRDL